MGLFDDEPQVRSAMVIAKTACEVAEISYEHFHKIRDQFPDILFAISRQVLAAADRSTLMERFHEVDNRLIKEDEQAAFPRLAEELGRKFEVPHSDAPPSVPAAAKMTPDTI